MLEYWKLDPFGCEWRQPAKICATLVNVNRTDGGLPLDERHFIAVAPPEDDGAAAEEPDEEQPLEPLTAAEEAAARAALAKLQKR